MILLMCVLRCPSVLTQLNLSHHMQKPCPQEVWTAAWIYRAASLIAGLDTISFKDVDKEPFTSLQTAFWPHRETPWNCVKYYWKPLKDFWLRLLEDVSTVFPSSWIQWGLSKRPLPTCSDIGSLCSMCRNSCSYLGNFSPSKEAYRFFNCLDSSLGAIYIATLGQVTIFCLVISCTAHCVSSELP